MTSLVLGGVLPKWHSPWVALTPGYKLVNFYHLYLSFLLLRYSFTRPSSPLKRFLNFEQVHVAIFNARTPPLSQFVVHRLGLAVIDLHTKFEVSTIACNDGPHGPQHIPASIASRGKNCHNFGAAVTVSKIMQFMATGTRKLKMWLHAIFIQAIKMFLGLRKTAAYRDLLTIIYRIASRGFGHARLYRNCGANNKRNGALPACRC